MIAVGWAIAVACYTLAAFFAGAFALAWIIVRCAKNVDCRTRSTLVRFLAGVDRAGEKSDEVSAEEDMTAGREMMGMHADLGAHMARCCACQSGVRCEAVRRSFC